MIIPLLQSNTASTIFFFKMVASGEEKNVVNPPVSVTDEKALTESIFFPNIGFEPFICCPT